LGVDGVRYGKGKRKEYSTQNNRQIYLAIARIHPNIVQLEQEV